MYQTPGRFFFFSMEREVIMMKQNIPELFASMVFDDRVMRSRLSADVYESLRKTIEESEKDDD